MDLVSKIITLYDSNGSGGGKHQQRLETIVAYLGKEWDKRERNGIKWNKEEWSLNCAKVWEHFVKYSN